jgi:hypothetical protein
MKFFVARIRRFDGDWSHPLTLFAEDLPAAAGRLNLEDAKSVDIRMRPDGERAFYGRDDTAGPSVREHPEVKWDPAD